MMKNRILKMCLSVALCFASAAGIASAIDVPINDAISSFEFVDLANTTAPTNDQLIADSEGWTVIADVDTANKPRTFNSGTVPDGAFSFAANPKNAGDLIHLQSTPIGHSLVEGENYQFSVDIYRGNISGKPEWALEVYTADTNLLGAVTNAVSATTTWETFSGTFTVGAADAGKDVFFRLLRDSTIGTMVPKGGNADNIVLETILTSGISDSARVLAFNVDGEKSDFEYVAENVGLDLSLTAALNGDSAGGSTDGSYGSFKDPLGADSSSEAYPWRAEGANSLVADVTITNNSSQSLKLDGLYFDVFRDAADSVRQVKLDYIGGDLATGTGAIYNFTLDTTAAISTWKFVDLTFETAGNVTTSPDLGFNAMSDATLGAGESATFRLTLQTSTDAATEPSQMLLDNIALIGDFYEDDVLVDWSSPDMFFGDQGSALLRLGGNTDVTAGDLYIRNYLPTAPLFDRGQAEYYQKQDIYGIMQTGNQGTGAEIRPFRYYKFTEANTSQGNLVMTVTPAGDDLNGTDIYQSTIIHYMADDFYDSIGAGETISSLAMSLVELDADDATVRFAVKNDGQWYISFAKTTSIGSFSLSTPALEGAWGALSAAASDSSSMMTADGVAFDTAGAAFTNVEAVGFFVEGSGGVAVNKVRFKYDSFTALAGPAPTEFPDAQVLAYNTDDNPDYFEYVKSGADVSVNIVSAQTGQSSNGSLDGSFGSFYDPVGADTNSAARPWRGRGTGDAFLIAEFTVSNVLEDSSMQLEGFYFDFMRLNTQALRQVQLDYVGGDLSGVSSGIVYSVAVQTNEFVQYTTNDISGGITNVVTVNPWADFDWTFAAEGATPSAEAVTFNAMADTSLAYGESATFRMSLIPSTDAATETGQAWLDNLALIGSFQIVGFNGWVSSPLFGLDAADQDAGDDPDGDGLTNLEEYARDGNPNDIFDTGTASTIEVASGVFNYVYPQRSDDETLNYYVELNDNLVHGTWTNSGYTVTGTEVTGGTLDFVTNEVSTVVEDAQFIRLIIEQM
ncbi:carbohydrate binding domain-containing protein [Pontiella sulfatireligans]|uniref:CBM-cenC domain-containing protein n=1 Tax=Pontiella sulfatireligans TaxID=2750658 RepID=A0A6C2UF58_9BACT|nr:hypothetical protein [Pontiella sulfatireligans]VGO18167.1 hypothetical protein SCARR_00218 [Pontiella sulfatireligans]